MTPDMKRLCEAMAEADYNEHSPPYYESHVCAVLEALKDATGETPRYAAGEWSRRNVEAMVADILAEPATA